MYSVLLRFLIVLLPLIAVLGPSAAMAQNAGSPDPLIYLTDLYYGIDDIDDYFDAAVLLKSPEIEILGFVLDNHRFPTDGDKAAAKLMEITGRKAPIVKGLGGFQMLSFTDKALYAPNQEGVEFILKTLRESKRKVALMAVGSMTDLTVAYLREPSLFQQKVSAVYVVAGSAESPEQDYNVSLDPRAFTRIMRSDLPIVWVPVDSSMWYFPAPEMLVPPKNHLSHFLLNELLYWYIRNDFKSNAHKDRYLYYDLGRWMWSIPGFVLAIGHPDAAEMFDLVGCKVEFDDRGVMTSLRLGVEDSNIRVVQNVNGRRLNEFIVERINR